ncbi:hypothetical protein HK405_007247, partial [Cladochytrium tenue]
MAASNKRPAPEWLAPPDLKPKLVVSNSLTHSKVEFVPANGNHVGWYSCGPTVYDASHLGHARTYVSLDILRRIMEDYFNYDVTYVMNITDIDDKIILAARRKYLFEQQLKQATQLTEGVIAEVKESFESYIVSHFEGWLTDKSRKNAKADLLKALDGKSVPGFSEWQAAQENLKLPMRFKSASRTLKAIQTAEKKLKSGTTGHEAAEALLLEAKDVFAEYLDVARKGSVTDHSIFRDFASYWENEYFKDMDALNVRRPDVLTRVSEYIPEIVQFVSTIIENGYAYESEGSVYFNSLKFDQDPSHYYAKLEPSSAFNFKLVEEGEGEIKVSGRKSKSDFALWKASKAGEPAWDSPWGKGRPGWHIECSAMASDVIGQKLDIHAGGIDLAFPHHDNEIAQSEEILDKYTPAQIRILFLQKHWNAEIDFKESSFDAARVFESSINNFLLNARSIIQEARATPAAFTGRHNFNKAKKTLLALFEDKQSEVYAALSDNFDTSAAMLCLRDIITGANTYIQTVASEKGRISADLISKVAKYITKMMKVFGVFRESGPEFEDASAQNKGGSVEDMAGPYVRLLSAFRDRVRELVRNRADLGEFLAASDRLRDEDLVNLNVRLDDRD